MIIGITGNSGTGKTLIAKAIKKAFKNEKTEIIDADKIAKELAVPNQEYFKKIVGLFGKEILTKEGIIDRKKLASIIFENGIKREKLNKITYKYVGEETKNRIAKSKSKTIIIDAPLLIESKLNKLCDVVISVIADQKTKLERICTRDNTDKKAALQRLNSQKHDEFYIKNSNYVVVNEDIDINDKARDLVEFLNANCYNNKIVIIQNKDLRFLQFKKLLEYRELSHAFTIKPMDFGSNKTYKDKKQEITNNYKAICKFLNLNYKDIVRPCQTHTKNVAYIRNETGIFPKELIDIDGAITDKENKILSLVFADCMPIFLYDKNKKIIANVHSGWQGTMQKIVKEAINKMIKKFNCDPKDIICLIGPTIRKCHFEVDEDIKNQFVASFKNICNEKRFVSKGSKKGKYYIDTVYLNKKMIADCKIPVKT